MKRSSLWITCVYQGIRSWDIRAWLLKVPLKYYPIRILPNGSVSSIGKLHQYLHYIARMSFDDTICNRPTYWGTNYYPCP